MFFKKIKGNPMQSTTYTSRSLATVFLFFSLGFATHANAFSIQTEDFHEGLASVKINGKGGYIDKTGKLVIPLQFDFVGDFREGLARVKVKGSLGYINKLGKFVIVTKLNAKSDLIDDFSEGMARIEVNGKSGYIDKTGKQVIPPQFDWAREFKDGLARVSINGKGGYIGKDGKLALEMQFDGDGEIFSEGLLAVRVGEKWGYIDKTGKQVITPKFTGANKFSDGLASVDVGDYYKAHYIDRDGNLVLSPQIRVNAASGFCEGLAAIEVGEKWGYINKSGQQLIELQFDSANDFSDGLAMIKVNGKPYYIDQVGKIIIDVQGSLVDEITTADVNEKSEKIQKVSAFRKSLSQGDETNCGSAIEVKGKLVKVAFAVANFGNEHWIRRDEVFPAGYECRFVNGQYQSPTL
jgi:hypothetical protein